MNSKYCLLLLVCAILSATLSQSPRHPACLHGNLAQKASCSLEESLHKAAKKQFKLDLTEIHAVCEANYARLMQLFPEYEHSNSREFSVGGARISLEVVERCRYTTIFRLQQHQPDAGWLGCLRVEVRAYHDAQMLEVGTFQSHRRVKPRYNYPNDHMYQQDEKSQQNRFLAEWLEHCLHNGRSGRAVIHAVNG